MHQPGALVVMVKFFYGLNICLQLAHQRPFDVNRSLEEPLCDHNDIGQAMWVILNDLGEMDHYLNNLFCYHSQRSY